MIYVLSLVYHRIMLCKNIPIVLSILDITVRLVNVPLTTTATGPGRDDLGKLPLEQSMAGHIMRTLDRAATESSAFFSINSNAKEITLYAASGLVDQVWGRTSAMGCYREDGLQISRSLWRVFQLECFNEDDVQDGEC